MLDNSPNEKMLSIPATRFGNAANQHAEVNFLLVTAVCTRS